MHRLRTARLAALLVGLAMVAAACGGGGDDGGGTSGGSSGQVQQGGTLNYAADQEPTGFNNNTSKDNGTSVANIVINMMPVAFHLTPDFKVVMNEDLLDSAEQTSEDPQTIVYKIKQNAAWSDGTPISADDFIYLWKNLQRHHQGQRRLRHHRLRPDQERRGLRQRQDGHGRLQDPVRRLEVRCSRRELHPARPLRGEAAGRLEHRPGQEPREDPLRRLVQGRQLHPWPEPDHGPQRQVLRAEVQPGLGRVPVPARVDHPAGGAAEQRGRPDLPAAPARPGASRSRPFRT